MVKRLRKKMRRRLTREKLCDLMFAHMDQLPADEKAASLKGFNGAAVGLGESYRFRRAMQRADRRARIVNKFGDVADVVKAPV